MNGDLTTSIQTMLWDMPIEKRRDGVRKILDNPKQILHDERMLIRALSSLSWYELVSLLGCDELMRALCDQTIARLFPPQRRKYYTHARRLLSKYAVSSAGHRP